MPSGARHDRQAARDQREAWSEVRRVASPERYVDLGVRIHVIRRADTGLDVIPGMAPVESLRYVDHGGIWDTVDRRWAGPSLRPRIWYATERALRCIEHGDDLPSSILVEAGMGAGKTTGWLAPWLTLRALELAPYASRGGIEIGATSPTDPRLEEYIRAVRRLMRPDWYQWHEHRHLLTMVTGVRIRFVGTARRSAAQGSRIQGWNWAAWGGDELQDNCEELAHIQARGRRAPGGRYRKCATATPKISSEWREARRRMMSSGEWTRERVDARDNPFVPPAYWEQSAREMSPRQFARMVEGKDVGPERQTYFTWDREQNIRPVPQLGARDVTREVLARFDAHSTVLVGYDPGTRYDVAVILKAYQMPGKTEPNWWVVDEMTLERVTTEQFADALVQRLRERWGCYRTDHKGRVLPDSPVAHVRVDPYGDTDAKTDKSVYQMLRARGIDARSAAYSQGRGKGRVPKDAGIEMVCRLLCNAKNERRLFVHCDSQGTPVAPRLVEALEMSERDIAERAEWEKKGSDEDRSHWPSALRYALYPFERLPEPMERLKEYG